MSDNTANYQGSCGVYALMGHSGFVKRGNVYKIRLNADIKGLLVCTYN